jgi:photosystem II stability/assembly factor-like uncharacterized protein
MMRSTAAALVAGQACVEKRLEPVERQVQAVQQQIDRFVPGVVGAVTEEQSAFVEAADGKAQQVAQGRSSLAACSNMAGSKASRIRR